MILKIIKNRSSKSTIHHFGWFCIWKIHFNNNWKYRMNSNEMIWIDLPSLQSIQLGWYSFHGIWNDDSCSLTMRSNYDSKWFNVDLPNLTSITSRGYSFEQTRIVILESIFENEYWKYLDIPNLQTAYLPYYSFMIVQSKSISSMVWLSLFPF